MLLAVYCIVFWWYLRRRLFPAARLLFLPTSIKQFSTMKPGVHCQTPKGAPRNHWLCRATTTASLNTTKQVASRDQRRRYARPSCHRLFRVSTTAPPNRAKQSSRQNQSHGCSQPSTRRFCRVSSTALLNCVYDLHHRRASLCAQHSHTGNAYVPYRIGAPIRTLSFM